MLVTTIVLLSLVVLSFILDVVTIRSKKFKERAESNKALKLICSEGVKVANSDTDSPIGLYLKNRYLGFVAVALCIFYIVMHR